MIFKILAFLIVALHSVNVSAEDNSVEKADQSGLYRIGLIGGGFHIWNQTTIPVYGLTNDCGCFSDGEKTSFFGGLTFGYNIIDDFLAADVRVLYESRPVYLEATTTVSDYLNPLTNQYEPFVRQYTYDAALEYVAFDLGARVKPLYYLDGFRDLPIFFRIGFEAAQPLFSTNYVKTEEILSPERVLFPDDTRKHVIGEGEISDAGTAYGAAFSLQSDIRLRSGMIITPEVSYRFGLNSIVSNSDWFADILRVGVAVSWEFGAEEPEQEPEPEIEIPVPDLPPAKEIIAKKPPVINSIAPDGLSITETVVTQTYPLLPYIFFDSASVNLRAKYKNSGLALENRNSYVLPQTTMAIYYHLLDIIGMRLAENADARITITGMTDGAEMTDAGERLELARYRAIGVGEYLQKKWGIARDRISIDSRNLPGLATSTEYREGYQENRRVEISSANPDILKPIVHSRFLEFSGNKNELAFETDVEDVANIESWSLSLDLPERTMIYVEDDGSPPKNIKLNLDQAQINRIGGEAVNNNQIKATLKIRTKDGELAEKTSVVGISRSRNQFEVGRLNLIVFDFDNAEISLQNQEMIREFILASIKQSSKSHITGSTDRLGELEYNKRLSLDRAESVERYLRRIVPDVDIESVKGIGASQLKFNNKLPEGRFYCRTVLIEVKTPLKNN